MPFGKKKNIQSSSAISKQCFASSCCGHSKSHIPLQKALQTDRWISSLLTDTLAQKGTKALGKSQTSQEASRAHLPHTPSPEPSFSPFFPLQTPLPVQVMDVVRLWRVSKAHSCLPDVLTAVNGVDIFCCVLWRETGGQGTSSCKS